jgi:hypothetical protein
MAVIFVLEIFSAAEQFPVQTPQHAVAFWRSRVAALTPSGFPTERNGAFSKTEMR